MTLRVLVLFLHLVLVGPRSAPASHLTTTGDWTRFDRNPVLEVAPDRGAAADPTILFDPTSNRFRIWFGHVAPHPAGGPAARIGYADSADGVRWENFQFELVPLGGPGTWDARHVETPHVIRDEQEPDPAKRYKLWYSGLSEDEFYQIGYATSPDGVGNWQKHGPPVLGLAPGELALADPSVLRREDGTYHLWFATVRLNPDGTLDGGIGYATSADGIRWTRHPGTIVLRGAGWDAQWGISGWPAQPYVLWTGRFYEMWYNAGLYPNDERIDPEKQALGYATSADGINWTRRDRPILVPDTARPSEANGWFPGAAAIYDGLTARLYYPAAAGGRVALQLALRPPTALTVGLFLNKSVFRPGELLQLGVNVANPGSPTEADVYVGVLGPPGAGAGLGCPNGDAVAFLVEALSRAVLTCLSAPPQSFPPLVRRLLLPGAVPLASRRDFWTVLWPTGLPRGTYTIFVAVTRPDALTDGRIDPDDVLTVAAATVSFRP